MFFPRLRPALTKVIVLFPSNQIDSILRDYRFFMKALSEHSDFGTFIPEFVLVIAFDPTVLYEESITKAIYDVLCASTMQKSQPLSQYIEPEVEEDMLPSNYAGLILKNLADCIPSKPWMLKFLSMAYKIPLCANLSLIRFLKTSNEQSCHRLIELLNSTFSSLLMEDNEKLKSRHPSTTTQYSSSFPLNISNISQMNQTISGSPESALSAKSCSVFESENAIMFLFAAVNLTEMLYKHIHLFDLKLFSTCLLRAKIQPNENRASFAFKMGGSFVDVIEDEELKTLVTDALIGLKDYQSLSQMPLHLRTKNNARALMAECKHDWGAMASICNTVEDKDTQAKALLAFGSLPSGCSKEVKYEAVVQLSSWNGAGNDVSFPKRAISHWEQLYSVIKKHKDGKTFKTLNFLNLSLEAVASKTIIDPFQLTCCRHLFLLQNLVQNRSCFIPDGVLRSSFHLANISRDESNTSDEETFENAVTAVVDQSKNLRKRGALLLSLKLLDAFDATTKKSISKLKPKNSDFSSLSMEIAIERAKTLVSNNDSDMAAFLLTELTDTANTKRISERIAKNVSRAYKLLGKLQPENCLNHLTVASKVTSKNELFHKNLLKLAIFSENDYQTTQDYMESSAFKLKQEFIDDFSSSPEANKTLSKKLSASENLHQHVLKMEKNVEENEIKLVKERRIKTLTFCIENYLKAVIHGNTDKTIAYRIVALMIQNTEEVQLMKLIKDNLNKFPSNVWLPVLNVLSSHLFSDKLPICEVVEEISIRTIGDYPYIGTRDYLFYLSDTSTNVHGTFPRHEKVRKLFEKCEKRFPHTSKIVQNLIKADRCFIEIGISEFQNSSLYLYSSSNRYEMTGEVKILKHIEHMRKIPIPTVSQPIFPPGDSRNYDIKEFITIKNIDKICFEAGGLSKPKVLTFYGSNNQKYKLIFKGEDLRQDSLVQQLFSVQNLIMEQNQRSSSTFSPLRTYSVIPLSPNCGIIEWCEGTTSLCSYLIGDKKDGGAHAHYRPNDILGSKAQQIMKSRQNGYNTTEVFLEICKNIQPVFRHFFYSKFNNSKDFHEAIDRYTQSLAQWSIGKSFFGVLYNFNIVFLL
uniref:PI3K/PI4K catalytic domain-containing protein n=1 Tax=Panagrolaimus superbus TaxID=310955 RepID=A0A914YL59_9BILA